MLSVREVTQRVPPTCTIKTSRTGGRGKCGWLPTHGTACARSTAGIGQRRRTNMCWTFDERERKTSRFDRWVVFPRLPNNVCRRTPNHGCWSVRPHTVPWSGCVTWAANLFCQRRSLDSSPQTNENSNDAPPVSIHRFPSVPTCPENEEWSKRK